MGWIFLNYPKIRVRVGWIFFSQKNSGSGRIDFFILDSGRMGIVCPKKFGFGLDGYLVSSTQFDKQLSIRFGETMK